MAVAGEATVCYQHPQGKKLHFSQKNVMFVGNNFLLHDCHTSAGCGGSVLYNSDHKAIGLHHAFLPLFNLNRATTMTALVSVLDKLMTQQPIEGNLKRPNYAICQFRICKIQTEDETLSAGVYATYKQRIFILTNAKTLSPGSVFGAVKTTIFTGPRKGSTDAFSISVDLDFSQFAVSAELDVAVVGVSLKSQTELHKKAGILPIQLALPNFEVAASCAMFQFPKGESIFASMGTVKRFEHDRHAPAKSLETVTESASVASVTATATEAAAAATTETETKEATATATAEAATTGTETKEATATSLSSADRPPFFVHSCPVDACSRGWALEREVSYAHGGIIIDENLQLIGIHIERKRSRASPDESYASSMHAILGFLDTAWRDGEVISTGSRNSDGSGSSTEHAAAVGTTDTTASFPAVSSAAITATAASLI